MSSSPHSAAATAAVSERLHVQRLGAGDPLVLLHGMGESSVGWRPVMRQLAQGHDVIAVDLPGFGRSPALPAHVPPLAANLATAVLATLDRMDVGDFHVAGYSLGARVALQLAGTDRVRSTIAIGPDGLGTPLERLQGYVGLLAGRGVAMALAPIATQLSMTPAGRSLFFAGNRSRPWQLEASDARELLGEYADAPAYDAANWVGMFDVLGDVRAIERPVLFLQGTADPLVAQVLRYLPLIPQARLQWLPGLNHVPISDDPAAVANAMQAFLRQ
jgi:pimeloyl-ACP methyl ester carboxylesterase